MAKPIEATGRIHILDRGGEQGETGWWPSLTVDSQDRPHLTYCDAYHGDLRYATRDRAGQWEVTSVVTEGAVGKYTAVAVAPSAQVGISFYDQDTKYLRYAWRTGDEPWQTENVAWGLEVGMGGELRFDADSIPHLFYYVPSGRLVHARKPHGGEWVKDVVADATGGFSVRIDSVLTPQGFWLSFLDWNLKYTTVYVGHQDAQGAWTTEKVTDRRSAGWRSQLVTAGKTDTELIYSESAKNNISVATRTPEGWKTRVLLADAANFAARRAPNGDTVIAYEDVARGSAGNGTIKYARGRSDSWRRYVVDREGPAGQYLAMALDSAGRPIIAYFAGDIRGLKVYDETLAPSK